MTETTTTDPWAAAEPEQAQPVQATDGQEHVRAERVEISQGGAGSIEATTVTVQQGGAGRVRARELSVSMGGVGIARTNSLRLGERANAFAVLSDQAEFGPGSSVFMLIAPRVSGEVRPVLDWRAAAAFGVGIGLALRLLRR